MEPTKTIFRVSIWLAYVDDPRSIIWDIWPTSNPCLNKTRSDVQFLKTWNMRVKNLFEMEVSIQ